jgi:hypothetical protein
MNDISADMELLEVEDDRGKEMLVLTSIPSDVEAWG